MSQTVEVNKEGTLLIPADVLEQMKPHTRFIVEVDQDRMVLRPENKGTRSRV